MEKTPAVQGVKEVRASSSQEKITTCNCNKLYDELLSLKELVKRLYAQTGENNTLLKKIIHNTSIE